MKDRLSWSRLEKLTVIGDSTTVNPKIKPMFAMFDPKRLPIGRPMSPELTAETEIASSGSEVTTERIRKPIAISPRPVILAIRVEESETMSLDLIRKARDTAKIAGCGTKFIHSVNSSHPPPCGGWISTRIDSFGIDQALIFNMMALLVDSFKVLNNWGREDCRKRWGV